MDERAILTIREAGVKLDPIEEDIITDHISIRPNEELTVSAPVIDQNRNFEIATNILKSLLAVLKSLLRHRNRY